MMKINNFEENVLEEKDNVEDNSYKEDQEMIENSQENFYGEDPANMPNEEIEFQGEIIEVPESNSRHQLVDVSFYTFNFVSG